MEKQKSFTCPKCGKESHNPNDVEHRYCGACNLFFAKDKTFFGPPLFIDPGGLKKTRRRTGLLMVLNTFNGLNMWHRPNDFILVVGGIAFAFLLVNLYQWWDLERLAHEAYVLHQECMDIAGSIVVRSFKDERDSG